MDHAIAPATTNRSGGLQGRHLHFTCKPHSASWGMMAALKAAATWREFANMAGICSATYGDYYPPSRHRCTAIHRGVLPGKLTVSCSCSRLPHLASTARRYVCSCRGRSGDRPYGLPGKLTIAQCLMPNASKGEHRSPSRRGDLPIARGSTAAALCRPPCTKTHRTSRRAAQRRRYWSSIHLYSIDNSPDPFRRRAVRRFIPPPAPPASPAGS